MTATLAIPASIRGAVAPFLRAFIGALPPIAVTGALRWSVEGEALVVEIDTGGGVVFATFTRETGDDDDDGAAFTGTIGWGADHGDDDEDGEPEEAHTLAAADPAALGAALGALVPGDRPETSEDYDGEGDDGEPAPWAARDFLATLIGEIPEAPIGDVDGAGITGPWLVSIPGAPLVEFGAYNEEGPLGPAWEAIVNREDADGCVPAWVGDDPREIAIEAARAFARALTGAR
jgi:hypothetical protein